MYNQRQSWINYFHGKPGYNLVILRQGLPKPCQNFSTWEECRAYLPKVFKDWRNMGVYIVKDGVLKLIESPRLSKKEVKVVTAKSLKTKFSKVKGFAGILDRAIRDAKKTGDIFTVYQEVDGCCYSDYLQIGDSLVTVWVEDGKVVFELG